MAEQDPIELPGVRITAMPSRGTKDGQTYWRARTTGRQNRRLVWCGWATRAEVTATVAALVARGLPSRPGTPGVRTVGDLLEAWADHQEDRHQGGQIARLTFYKYRLVAGYWLAALGDISVRRLTRAHVEDTITRWQAEGVAPRTCKLAADVLVSAWRWGAARELCDPLDLSRLAVLRVRASERIYNSTTPTRDEVRRILAQVPPGRNRDVLLLLTFTGARAGEIAALRVGSYERGARVLVLTGHDRSRGRRGKVEPRRWPVAGELRDLLDRLIEDRSADEPLVEGLPQSVDGLARDVLGRACRAAGLPRITSHGLRRMVVMELLETTDPATVSRLTGHSVATLLRSYVRPRDEQLRDVVARAGTARLDLPGQVIELPTNGRR